MALILLFHRIRRRKTIMRPTLVSEFTFDSLWLYEYDLRNYSAIIWAKQTRIIRFGELLD